MACPVTSSATPTAAASATDGCDTSALSISAVPRRWPDTFTTSSMRPITQKNPSASRRAPSPVKYLPGKREKYCCLKRSSSPHTVRNIEGHGLSITSRPPSLTPASVPSWRSTFGEIPKNGSEHEPGLLAIAPGSGVITIDPVSVCQYVSTMGQRSPPIVFRYHIHASGLIGSPTVPSKRKEDRSCLVG